MYVIQRTKTATDPNGKTTGDPKVHYAARIDPRGNVSEWTGDRAKAVRVDDTTALRVEDYYTAKLAAGQPVGIVTAVDVVPVAPPVTKPDTTDAE
mgnify:CR=1 FL=1